MVCTTVPWIASPGMWPCIYHSGGLLARWRRWQRCHSQLGAQDSRHPPDTSSAPKVDPLLQRGLVFYQLHEDALDGHPDPSTDVPVDPPLVGGKLPPLRGSQREERRHHEPGADDFGPVCPAVVLNLWVARHTRGNAKVVVVPVQVARVHDRQADGDGEREQAKNP